MDEMKRRRFEVKNGRSYKQWSVGVKGPVVQVRYGAIGTREHVNQKRLATHAAACAEAAKLIRSKLRKGYVEVVEPGAWRMPDGLSEDVRAQLALLSLHDGLWRHSRSGDLVRVIQLKDNGLWLEGARKYDVPPYVADPIQFIQWFSPAEDP